MVDTNLFYIVVMLFCLCPTVVGIKTSRLSRITDKTEVEPENRIWPRFLTGGAACPDGWKHRNKSCYHINQEKTTWTEAQKRCELHDSHLVYIESAQEQSVLETLLHHIYGYDVNADYWAGASDWNIEGKWVWEPNLKPLTYTNWFPGQPNNGRYSGHNIHEPGFDDQNCLLLRYNHSFQWIDTECSGHHFYVCELPAAHTHRRPTQTIIRTKSTTIPTSQMPTKTKSMKISTSKTPTTTAQISSSTKPTTAACPDGWKQMNQSCYHVNQESTTWTEAQKMCELHDSHLVYIESAQEQSVLETLLHHIYGYDVNADYWAGASDWNIEGKWVWEPNLEPLTYTNWFPGQPNNGRYSGHNIHEPGFDDQNCLLLRYNHSFQWIDTECNGHHFYVCELPAAHTHRGSTQTIMKTMITTKPTSQRPTKTTFMKISQTPTTTQILTSQTPTASIKISTSRTTTKTISTEIQTFQTKTTRIPTTTRRQTTRTPTSTSSKQTTASTTTRTTTTSRPPPTTTRKIPTTTSRPPPPTTREIPTTTSRPTTTTTTTTTRKIPTTTSRPPPPTTRRTTTLTTSRPTTTTRKIPTTTSRPPTTTRMTTTSTTSRPTTTTTRKIPTTTSRTPPTTTRMTPTLTTSRPTTTTTRKIPTTTSRPTTTTTTTKTTTTRKIPTTTSRPPPTTTRMTTTSTTSRPTTITTTKIPTTTSRSTTTTSTTTRNIPTTTSRPTTSTRTTTSTTIRPITTTRKIPTTTSRQTLTTTTEKTFITEKHVSTSTQKTTTTEEEVVLIG